MAKGEEEYRSGLAKLKSARIEMQRLSASLAKGERSASGEHGQEAIGDPSDQNGWVLSPDDLAWP